MWGAHSICLNRTNVVRCSRCDLRIQTNTTRLALLAKSCCAIVGNKESKEEGAAAAARDSGWNCGWSRLVTRNQTRLSPDIHRPPFLYVSASRPMRRLQGHAEIRGSPPAQSPAKNPHARRHFV